MPFWQQCQCCRNCRFWRQADPSDITGKCTWGVIEVPFWWERNAIMIALGNTSHDEGQSCPVYRHDAHKPHPLDRARIYLAQAQVGDVITLRTYDIGEVSRTEALVLRHTSRFVVIQMFNDHKRIRLDATTSHYRAGTVVGMEDWGVDLQAPIQRGAVPQQHPELAEAMLAKVKRGDRVPVLGYPPFDGQRKLLHVASVTKNLLYLSFGRRKIRMYRAGPMAGIIEGEFWALDTTEETTNEDVSTALGSAASSG